MARKGKGKNGPKGERTADEILSTPPTDFRDSARQRWSREKYFDLVDDELECKNPRIRQIARQDIGREICEYTKPPNQAKVDVGDVYVTIKQYGKRKKTDAKTS